MNAVEIEEAITSLADQEIDAANFAFAFVEKIREKTITNYEYDAESASIIPIAKKK